MERARAILNTLLTLIQETDTDEQAVSRVQSWGHVTTVFATHVESITYELSPYACLLAGTEARG